MYQVGLGVTQDYREALKWYLRAGCVVALLSALAPKPDPQARQHDEGQDADPERDADIACPHVHTEEDSEQLCEAISQRNIATTSDAGLLFIHTPPPHHLTRGMRPQRFGEA